MKNKFSKLLISSIGLVGVLFSCNKGGGEDIHLWKDFKYVDINYHEKTCYKCEDHKEGHTEKEYHHWDEGSILRPATHIEKGEKVFVCKDCGGKRYSELPKLTEHVYDRCIVSKETFKEAATCEHPAVYYKSCECGEISETDTFYHGDKLDHDIDSFTVEGELAKKEYDAYEKVDLTGLTFKYTCKTCGEHTLDPKDVVVIYPNNTDSFRYDNSQTTQSITVTFNGLTQTVDGITVKQLNNEITGLEDMNIHCRDTIDLSNVKAKYGEVKFEIKDKDGDVVSPQCYNLLDEEFAPYTITAKVNAADQYKGVEISKTINVEHNLVYDEETGLETCKCGKSALNYYYYDKENDEVVTDYVDGLYADKFDESTTIIDAETGEEPDWTDVEPTYDNYKDLIATFEDGTSCRFRGHAVKDFIASNDDFNNKVCMQDSEQSHDGYYVLSQDIESVTSTKAPSSKNITIVFDGAGHSIKHLTVASGTCLFGGCDYTNDPTTKITMRNLVVEDYTSNNPLLAAAGVNNGSSFAKFENVKFIFNSASTNYILCYQGMTNLISFKNVNFDMSELKNYVNYLIRLNDLTKVKYPIFDNCVFALGDVSKNASIIYQLASNEYSYNNGIYTSYIEGLTFIE